MDFNVRAASDLGLSSDATQANWDAIYFSSLTQTLPAAGFFLADGAAYTFEGAAVPEPSSIAILSGLGLVFARGAWRRRNAKTIEIA